MDGILIMTITLTDEQNGAVKAIKEWFNDKSICTVKPFILAGFAGTGKSSILPFIIDALGLKDFDVHYCAYTGKAAMVLRKKGLPATTIHSLMYVPYTDDRGKLRFKRNTALRYGIKLIVVDEASMVNKGLKEDLETYDIPILYVGDHGQLPPISKDQVNLMLRPNYRLERIHRQALDNPIIQVATMVRKGYPINYGEYGTGQVKKVKWNDVSDEMLINSSQIICGKNDTRRQLNSIVRKLAYGWEDMYPMKGDKLICLKNNNTNGLVNGMLGECKAFNKSYCELSFQNDDNETWEYLEIDMKVFEEGVVGEWQKGVEAFDFGYALTCHKSQGSQFDKVLLYEELLGRDLEMHKRWLYTAVTRACNELIIVG